MLATAWPLPRGAAATRSLSRVCASSFLEAFVLGACLSVLPHLAEALRFEGSAHGAGLFVLAILAALAPGTAGTAWEKVSAHGGRRLACLASGLCRTFGLACMAVSGSRSGVGAGVALWAFGVGSLALAADSVCDVVPLERRLAALGLLVVAVVLGLAAGANLGGLLPHAEPRLSLWLCASLSLGGVAHALAFLPEAEARGRR